MTALTSAPVLVPALLVLHLALAWFTLSVYARMADVPVVFFASGVSWAGFMLLRGGARWWFGAGALLSQFSGELFVYGSPPALAFIFSLSKTGGAFIGVWAVQRVTGMRQLRPAVGDVSWFGFVGCIIVPLVMAILPYVARQVASDVVLIDYFSWALVEACGIIVMAPALIFWLQPRQVRISESAIEAVLLALAALAVIVGAVILPPAYGFQHTPFYATTPVMIWAAARFGCRGAGLISLTLTLSMIGAALVSLGPFHDHQDLNLSVIELQLFIVVTTGMTLLLGAYAEGREVSRQRRAVDRRRLQQLSLRLLESEERYRDSLATRLHDGIGQTLALGRMRLDDLAETPAAPSRLDPVRQAFDTAIAQVRDMTRDVSMGLYRGNDLAAVARTHLDTVFDGTGVETAIEADALPALRHDVAIVMSRSIRECLVNAAKHARARRVRVQFDVADQPPRFVVRIADDGDGFDAEALDLDAADGDRFGLASVRNSMLVLGGAFTVRTSPGAGTTITLEVPLDRATPASA